MDYDELQIKLRKSAQGVLGYHALRAIGELRARIAELEAENGRLRSILTELAGAESDERMGLYCKEGE